MVQWKPIGITSISTRLHFDDVTKYGSLQDAERLTMGSEILRT
jgi:hypothetical protein